MAREIEQEAEWLEAQKIEISVDLCAAAKQQLQFLAAVDRTRWLYEDPALHRAIYRYNAFWLPLLAKHSETPVTTGPLVVPLDCEWIWHCHRLNPVRYKSDCEEFYGKVLDNSNVVSSIQDSCKTETEDVWNRLYPGEPFNLNSKAALADDGSRELSVLDKCTKYDLVSAVKRQIPFYYQVSGAHVNYDIFVEEAVARYKGFLYLIKRNRERSINRFCVPTYDVDLIWHTHQLQPASYCNDLMKIIGKVLEHDDTDSDRSKGKKLDTGFSGTTAQWEKTFGTRYWKAGAMYRGKTPTSVTSVPFSSGILGKKLSPEGDCQSLIQIPEVNAVEVLLEIVDVKNLPDGQKGNLFVVFGKSQPDCLFNVKRRLTVLSESGKKQVASFQCEQTGKLLFELMSYSHSKLPVRKEPKKLGSASMFLQEFLFPVSKLSVEKWFDLVPNTGKLAAKPISLRIAVSFTPPVPAQSEFHLLHSKPCSKGSCFFPIVGKAQQAKSWTRVVDEAQTEIISLQMRNTHKREVIGIGKSGETHVTAAFTENSWSLLGSRWCLNQTNESDSDGPLFELVGDRMVKIYRGRKLEYEPKHCEKQAREQEFVTAVEFSTQHPYGKAVGLLNLKSGSVKVKQNWLVLPGIVSAFILNDIVRKGGYDALIKSMVSDVATENPSEFLDEGKERDTSTMKVAAENALASEKGTAGGCGGCGAGCGGGCGNLIKSGGCGGGCGNILDSGGCGTGGCGGGCGNLIKSGGCGSGCGGGCGGGCGNILESGGCGTGGCGGGCGNIIESGSCKASCMAAGAETWPTAAAVTKDAPLSGGCGSGGCGSGCGNSIETGGCGGGCSGGCGNIIESGSCKASCMAAATETWPGSAVVVEDAVAVSG